jgi:hypothetical protein
MVITEAVVVPPMAPVPPLVIAAVPDLDVPAPTAEEANGDLDQPKAPPDTPSMPVSSAQRLSEFLSSITYPATPAPAAANGRHNHNRVSQNHDRDGQDHDRDGQNHDRDGQNQNGLHPDDHPGGGEHPAEAPVPALVGGPAPVRPGAAPASPGREPGETAPLIDLSARRRVSGRVTASTGEPLPGATITLVGAQGEQAGLVIAGEDGSFALGDLLEGTYTLVAAAPHYRAAASVVSLRDTEARTYVSLLGIGSLAGSITREKDGGSLEAEVELLNPAGTPVLKCRTDGGGRFILPDVLEGHYVLVVHCTSYRSHNTPVDIGRGVTRQVEVGLTGVGYVYGAVSSPGGAWVAGVPVTLRDSAGDVIATTHTDGAGSFHFPAVAEGRYTVTAAVTSSATAVIDIDAGRAVAADLTLETG